MRVPCSVVPNRRAARAFALMIWEGGGSAGRQWLWHCENSLSRKKAWEARESAFHARALALIRRARDEADAAWYRACDNDGDDLEHGSVGGGCRRGAIRFTARISATRTISGGRTLCFRRAPDDCGKDCAVMVRQLLAPGRLRRFGRCSLVSAPKCFSGGAGR